jgi:acyl-CoA reductase-like NAD-dependent aldehyde dehydrogenase
MNAKISESVSNYLSTSPISHFIGGDWQPSADGQAWNVINPADGSVLATTSLGGAREINSAVEAAHKAFPGWAATPPNERSALLHRFAERAEKESATLAQIESLDVGKAISLAQD